MKKLFLILGAVLFAGTSTGCDNSERDRLDAERQARHKNLYRVPGPSDRSKDRWDVPPTAQPKESKGK